MNKTGKPFGHTLIVGAGPAGIHMAVDLARRGWCSDIGLLNREGVRNEQIHAKLKKHGNLIKAVGDSPAASDAGGEACLDIYYAGYLQVEDHWNTIVLATPADRYPDAAAALRLSERAAAKRIVLLSPGIGSALLLQSALGTDSDRFEIVSLSSYYAASRLDQSEDRALTVIVKGKKKKIELGTSCPSSPFAAEMKRFVEELGIQCGMSASPLEAECSSITTYVHPPFFMNRISLEEIFNVRPSKKFMYKLYPEGPITPHSIRSMTLLWKELSAVIRSLGIEPLNLLRFLNDNYPVRVETLSSTDIDRFPEAEPIEQEYMLYVRYASIQIDPFSDPDENGRYYDFSAFPYEQVKPDGHGGWSIPRVPYEDYMRLKLMKELGEAQGIIMKEADTLIHNFENAAIDFADRHGGMSFPLQKITVQTKRNARQIIDQLAWRGKRKEGVNNA